jgi:hypothetical protein
MSNECQNPKCKKQVTTKIPFDHAQGWRKDEGTKEEETSRFQNKEEDRR